MLSPQVQTLPGWGSIMTLAREINVSLCLFLFLDDMNLFVRSFCDLSIIIFVPQNSTYKSINSSRSIIGPSHSSLTLFFSQSDYSVQTQPN